MKKKLSPLFIFIRHSNFRNNICGKIFLILLCSFCFVNVIAQNAKKIKGTVTDDKGAPLQGAILAGDAHHTCFSQNLTSEHLENFADMAGTEIVFIDKETKLRDFKDQLSWNEPAIQ